MRGRGGIKGSAGWVKSAAAALTSSLQSELPSIPRFNNLNTYYTDLNMSKFFTSILCAVLLGSTALSVPVGDVSTSTLASSSSSKTASKTSDSPAQPSPTVPYASDDPNYWLWNETTTEVPQPERGTFGANIQGPQNVEIDRQNPDILAPPTTDSGTVYVTLPIRASGRTLLILFFG